MRSQLAVGNVFHQRSAPRQHQFTYPIFHLVLDVDEFDAGATERVLSTNCFGLFSIRTNDYLTHLSTSSVSDSIRSRVESVLRDNGITEASSRIELVTMPRILGYAFNPVNFFLCWGDQGDRASLAALVVQVSNTFGERHVYVLKSEGSTEDRVCYRFPKSFYVSPFFDTSGEYKLTCHCNAQAIDISVELLKEGASVFIAHLREQRESLSHSALIRTAIRMPFSIVGTMAQIHLQAFIIFLKRSARLHHWQKSSHPSTIHSKQSIVHHLRHGLLNLFRMLERLYAPEKSEIITISKKS